MMPFTKRLLIFCQKDLFCSASIWHTRTHTKKKSSMSVFKEDRNKWIIISLSAASIVPVGVYYLSHASLPHSITQALINATLMNLAVEWTVRVTSDIASAIQHCAHQGTHDDTDNAVGYSLFSLVLTLHIYTCHSNDTVKEGKSCEFAVTHSGAEPLYILCLAWVCFLFFLCIVVY